MTRVTVAAYACQRQEAGLVSGRTPMDKQLKALFRERLDQGWLVKESRKGRMTIPPDGSKPIVAIHGTTRGARSWENMLAQLKRSGFVVRQ